MNRAHNAVSELLISRQKGVAGNDLRKGRLRVSSHQERDNRSLSLDSGRQREEYPSFMNSTS